MLRRQPRDSGVATPEGLDRGATAGEYALVASLIAVVIVAGVTALGLAVQGLFVFPVGL